MGVARDGGRGTRFAPGHGFVNKSVATAFLGPIGMFASSRKEIPVTITWTRTPEAADQAAADAKEGRRQINVAAKARSVKILGGEDQFSNLIAKVDAGERLAMKDRLAISDTSEYRAAKSRAKASKKKR